MMKCKQAQRIRVTYQKDKCITDRAERKAYHVKIEYYPSNNKYEYFVRKTRAEKDACVCVVREDDVLVLVMSLTHTQSIIVVISSTHYAV